MKILIRFVIVIFLISLASESFAQKFGLQAGLNMANMVIKDDDDTYSDDFKMNPGFHIGPIVEFPINDLLSFETGALLTTKGFKVSEKDTEDGETYEIDGSMNLFYLDIPLTAKATFDMGGFNFYTFAGPYVGMGLSGKSKFDYKWNGSSTSYEEDIKWGSDEDEDDLKRLDYGVKIGLGVEINSVRVGLSYGLGLANVSTDTEDGYKNSHQVLGVSVGVVFGGR